MGVITGTGCPRCGGWDFSLVSWTDPAGRTRRAERCRICWWPASPPPPAPPGAAHPDATRPAGVEP